MKKRILPLLLSLALCASLLTPALAAETVTLTGSGMENSIINHAKLTGVLAQEEVTLEFRDSSGQANDIGEVYEEQVTLYTVGRDFTVSGNYADEEDWYALDLYSGYRLSEDGKYVLIGYGEGGSYRVYAPDDEHVPVTREEFLSKCDLIKITTDLFYIDVWVRVEDGAADPTTPAVPTVAPSPCKGTLDGMMLTLNAYLFQENGGGSNYVMLRDIAKLLNGTKAQFEVAWDKDKGIILTTGQAYTAVGGELQSKGDGAKSYVPNAGTITIDGNAVELTAYTIEGNNYFKLRDLGAALGFNVSWDGATNTLVIDSTQPYSGAN